MSEGYRKGLATFKASDFDHKVGDNAVRGKGREAPKTLAQLLEAMNTVSTEMEHQALANAQHLNTAVQIAHIVARGGLPSHVAVNGNDEIAELRRALTEMQAELTTMVKQVLSSAAAAKEIKALISACLVQVEAGSKQADAAGDKMSDVVKSIQQAADLVGAMAMF